MSTVTAPGAPSLAIGQQIQAQAGRAVITLQRLATAVWGITVYVGSRREDDLCSSFDTERAAALAASGYLSLYRAEAAA